MNIELVFQVIGKTYIEAIHRLFDLNVVIHAGRHAEILMPRHPIINGKHGADIVDHAAFRIVEQPMEFRGKHVFETAVRHLIADLQTVTPIQFWVDPIVTHALIPESGHHTASI